MMEVPPAVIFVGTPRAKSITEASLCPAVSATERAARVPSGEIRTDAQRSGCPRVPVVFPSRSNHTKRYRSLPLVNRIAPSFDAETPA
jgi:hypothetical protein